MPQELSHHSPRYSSHGADYTPAMARSEAPPSSNKSPENQICCPWPADLLSKTRDSCQDGRLNAFKWHHATLGKCTGHSITSAADRIYVHSWNVEFTL
jgi:hypothetical protein